MLGLFAAGGAAGVRRGLEVVGSDRIHPLLERFLTLLGWASPGGASADECGALLAELDRFRGEVLGFMERFDAIVCPVAANPALPHGVRWDDEVLPGFRYTMAHNLTGWHNYSLFMRDDGLLFGYLETDDFDKALAAMAERDVNLRWQRDMAPFFEIEPGRRPDQSMLRLEEVFHLD